MKRQATFDLKKKLFPPKMWPLHLEQILIIHVLCPACFIPVRIHITYFLISKHQSHSYEIYKLSNRQKYIRLLRKPNTRTIITTNRHCSKQIMFITSYLTFLRSILIFLSSLHQRLPTFPPVEFKTKFYKSAFLKFSYSYYMPISSPTLSSP